AARPRGFAAPPGRPPGPVPNGHRSAPAVPLHLVAPGPARSGGPRWRGRRSSRSPSPAGSRSVAPAAQRATGAAGARCDARPEPPCRRARPARSRVPPAWPASRPGRRRGAPSAGAGCRVDGRPRTAAGSVLHARPAGCGSQASRPTTPASRLRCREPPAARRSRGLRGRTQGAGHDRRPGRPRGPGAHRPIGASEQPRQQSRARPKRQPPRQAAPRTARRAPSARRIQEPRAASPTAVLLALLVDPPLLEVGGARIILVEALEHGTGFLLLVEHRERDAELQEIVRPLRAGLVDLVALGEGDHRLLILTPRVVGLAQPVLRIAGQRMLRIVLHERLEGTLGAGVVAILQELEGVMIELFALRAASGRRR